MGTNEILSWRVWPFAFGLAMAAACLSWLVRSPLGFVVFFGALVGVTFGLLLGARAIVRARARRTEA